MVYQLFGYKHRTFDVTDLGRVQDLTLTFTWVVLGEAVNTRPAEYLHVGGHTMLSVLAQYRWHRRQFPEEVHGMSLPATATWAARGSAGETSGKGNACCSKMINPRLGDNI
jgi:hypothetical protein